MDRKIINAFTEEEKKAIKELKALLPEIIKDSRVPENYTLWGISLDKDSSDDRPDVILRKFLKARNLDVNLAKEMLTNSLKWRIEFKTDSILSETFPESIFAKVGFIHKHDKYNRPVTYNLYGGLDNNEVFGDLDRFLRWRVQLMEKGIQHLDFVKVDQIRQLSGIFGKPLFSIWYSKFKRMASLIYYLEKMQAVKFFINVPWWGDFIFKFISMFLSEETKSKFIVASHSNVKECMTAAIDEGNLPVAYGGQSIVPGFEVEEVNV
ncbi:2407_t:CDS:2 [Acaulospora morrowiae]|uniref:2407_t:CDS:1 n=1 Tax=Acaulospora morrowiae TaxID=94023 RepID=A0A9N9A6K9_9GLOM|nr:2407_t:CDS:2 [Acaulospora morrowiae]